MFLQKKVDRAFKWLKEKNKLQDHSEENKEWEENDIELEKEDILAIVLSALIVFGPIFLVLIIILILLL